MFKLEKVFADNGEVERYNIFHVAMILRHDKDGKKYLYDIMNISARKPLPTKWDVG